jgi:hypothetical protein
LQRPALVPSTNSCRSSGFPSRALGHLHRYATLEPSPSPLCIQPILVVVNAECPTQFATGTMNWPNLPYTDHHPSFWFFLLSLPEYIVFRFILEYSSLRGFVLVRAAPPVLSMSLWIIKLNV